jgi:biopolymer transport protein ExbB
MFLIDIFRSGGPVMWPLMLSSLVAFAIIIERSINLRLSRVVTPGTVERVSGLVEGGRVDKAVDYCRRNPGIFTNIVLAGLELADRGESAAREAVEGAGRHETALLNRYLGTLGTVAGVAPLLGLLGTVLGMIDVFRTIAQAGVGQAADLADGISQALITTATGLTIAIPALVAHNFFREKAETIITDLEAGSIRVLRGMFLDTGGGHATTTTVATESIAASGD